MIVVLDTNVIVAALVAKGLCHEVVVRALASGTVVTSAPLLDELEHTLRQKFTLGPAALAFLDQLRLHVRIVEPPPLGVRVSRDADDDVAMATAVAAGATLIVSGDQDLLVIGRHDGIDIVSPREFLIRLSRQSARIFADVLRRGPSAPSRSPAMISRARSNLCRRRSSLVRRHGSLVRPPQ